MEYCLESQLSNCALDIIRLHEELTPTSNTFGHEWQFQFQNSVTLLPTEIATGPWRARIHPRTLHDMVVEIRVSASKLSKYVLIHKPKLFLFCTRWHCSNRAWKPLSLPLRAVRLGVIHRSLVDPLLRMSEQN